MVKRRDLINIVVEGNSIALFAVPGNLQEKLLEKIENLKGKADNDQAKLTEKMAIHVNDLAGSKGGENLMQIEGEEDIHYLAIEDIIPPETTEKFNSSS